LTLSELKNLEKHLESAKKREAFSRLISGVNYEI